MKSGVRLPLDTTPEQAARLAALQQTFAAACNALGPRVAEQRCWNRVALHHLAYKDLREAFPALGSQMACNAIYAVCLAARLVYQHPKSPFNVGKMGNKPLPRLQFMPQSPVFFDRHTLSLKAGEVSLFTLEGRQRFPVRLSAETEQRLRTAKLREALLIGNAGRYHLTFKLADEAEAQPPAPAGAAARPPAWPSHLNVLDTDGLLPQAAGAPVDSRPAPITGTPEPTHDSAALHGAAATGS